MLMNNLDPDVAERPDDLVVYGGSGKAARNWESFDAIVASLRALENDETLLVQSGKPVAVFRTHTGAPRVLIVTGPDKTPATHPTMVDLLYDPKLGGDEPTYIKRGLPSGAYGLDLRDFYLA